MSTNFDPTPFCGWGVWTPDNRTFLPELTGRVIGQIAMEMEAEPGRYPGLYRRLPTAMPIMGDRRMMLWSVVRQLIGGDPPVIAQEVGDCVAHGARNAIEHLSAFEIAIARDREEWKAIYPPYLYGTGRVQVGGGLLGGQDGSLGVWQADAVMKYGCIPSDAEGCPPYSGRVARQWGMGQGPPRKFLELGAQYLVRSAALVRTWDDVVQAVCNGYPVTIASDVGFTMEPDRSGFHRRQGSWAHQMCIVGVDDEFSDPYAIVKNSWGDAHGRLKDFESGEELPVGCLRVHRRDIEAIIRQGDSFAYSSFDGFEARSLPDDFWMPW